MKEVSAVGYSSSVSQIRHNWSWGLRVFKASVSV